MLTDLNVHTEPSLPSLPAAGGTLTDPVFGTEILRVKAGASGTTYKLTFVLTLSDGSVLEEDILMVVADR